MSKEKRHWVDLHLERTSVKLTTVLNEPGVLDGVGKVVDARGGDGTRDSNEEEVMILHELRGKIRGHQLVPVRLACKRRPVRQKPQVENGLIVSHKEGTVVPARRLFRAGNDTKSL